LRHVSGSRTARDLTNRAVDKSLVILEENIARARGNESLDVDTQSHASRGSHRLSDGLGAESLSPGLLKGSKGARSGLCGIKGVVDTRI
jgi:hypothetical protein